VERLGHVLPEIVLLAGGLVLIAGSGRGRAGRTADVWVALVAVAAAMVRVSADLGSGARLGGGGVVVDPAASFAKLVVLGGLLGSVGLTAYARAGLGGRFLGTLLVASAALCLLAGAGRSEVLVLAAAIVAFAVRALAAGEGGAAPRALAGHLVATIGGGLLLVLGLALLWAVTGSPRLDPLVLPGAYDPGALAFLVPEGADPGRALVTVGAVLASLGLTPLLLAAPLGLWTPAVAEAAPAPVGAWLTTSLLAGGAAVAGRLLGGLPLAAGGGGPLAFLGVATVLAGSGLALREAGLRRLVTWLAVAQGGWVLLAAASSAGGSAAGDAGGAALGFLLAACLLAHLAAFAAVMALEDATGGSELERLVGVGRRNPWLAGMVVVALASAAGLPLTVGFPAKVWVAVAAFGAGHGWAAGGAVLALVLALAACLRVARLLYHRDAAELEPREPPVASSGLTLLAGALALLVVVVGVFPGGLAALAGRAAGR